MQTRVKTINIKQINENNLCRLIDIAGFKTIFNKNKVTLIDKLNPNSEEYSDLEFKDIYEATKAISPYINKLFRLVYQ